MQGYGDVGLCGWKREGERKGRRMGGGLRGVREGLEDKVRDTAACCISQVSHRRWKGNLHFQSHHIATYVSSNSDESKGIFSSPMHRAFNLGSSNCVLKQSQPIATV